MNSAEIIIRIADQHYFATLLVDGLVDRQTVSDKWPEMAVWAHQIGLELGTDIYARLKNIRTDSLQTTLALACCLGNEGFTVGLEMHQQHCPEDPLRLQ